MQYITLTLVGYDFQRRCALSFLVYSSSDELSFEKYFVIVLILLHDLLRWGLSYLRQAILDCSTVEQGTERLSRNVGK
jgi:hypothetical protein